MSRDGPGTAVVSRVVSAPASASSRAHDRADAAGVFPDGAVLGAGDGLGDGVADDQECGWVRHGTVSPVSVGWVGVGDAGGEGGGLVGCEGNLAVVCRVLASAADLRDDREDLAGMEYHKV